MVRNETSTQLSSAQIAKRVVASLAPHGIDAQVEDRGATVSWTQPSGLVGVVGLSGSSRANELFATVGVVDEPSERTANALLAQERLNLSPGDLVRGSYASKRIEELTPAPREWTRDQDSVDALCADIIKFGLPYIASITVDDLVRQWSDSATGDPPREAAALTLFCFLVSRGECDEAVEVLERFAREAPRPGTQRLARERLERARALGLLNGQQ